MSGVMNMAGVARNKAVEVKSEVAKLMMEQQEQEIQSLTQLFTFDLLDAIGILVKTHECSAHELANRAIVDEKEGISVRGALGEKRDPSAERTHVPQLPKLVQGAFMENLSLT
ncbi:hypothetical protein SELMODRAFT_410627 [Selaginella moellendorffii]|uniref:Uncharacterized protein n=1 Tax=Selaginella moellendorffii TaxID=88036 RepID=D8RFC3_SELML|nr:hypothetical protein SELMODRAFT_410627 [Selaginella moellendorffii]